MTYRTWEKLASAALAGVLSCGLVAGALPLAQAAGAEAANPAATADATAAGTAQDGSQDGSAAEPAVPDAQPAKQQPAKKQKTKLTMTAKKDGSWKYRKENGKKVKVSYRFEDGTYPATITRIGKRVYYFKNAKGKLGRSSKRLRVVKVGKKRYGVLGTGELSEGWQHAGSSLYCFGSTKYHAAIADKAKDGIELSSNGKANVNLNAALKLKCMKLLDKIATPGASKSAKLRAAWNWSTKRSRFRYVNYEVNTKDRTWAKRYANEMLTTHLGECQGFAAMFCALASEAGYDPYLVSCRVPGTRDHAADGYTGHACVMINGKWYDPEAQFAGWARGVYGKKRYPMGMKSKKLHRWSAYVGTGAALGITKSFNSGVSYSVGVKGSSYYCYYKGKRLTGLRVIKGKLYKFDGDGYMKKSLFEKVQTAAAEGKPWSKLRKLIGKPKKTKLSNSCYGDGEDRVCLYPHVQVTTFVPADGGTEVVESFVAR